jgi:phosphoenolpyruvate synthase/pyruvate phosphate dikinase
MIWINTLNKKKIYLSHCPQNASPILKVTHLISYAAYKIVNVQEDATITQYITLTVTHSTRNDAQLLMKLANLLTHTRGFSLSHLT